MRAFVMNVVIASVWLLLSPEPTSGAFAIGFLLGFLLLALFQSLMQSQSYVRRASAFLMFLLLFLREFTLANLAVARTVVLGSRKDLYPNFITLDVAGMRPFEILILSYCITLTPGTTSVEIQDDFTTLIVHALDAKDPDHVRRQINQALRDPILRFTR